MFFIKVKFPTSCGTQVISDVLYSESMDEGDMRNLNLEFLESEKSDLIKSGCGGSLLKFEEHVFSGTMASIGNYVEFLKLKGFIVVDGYEICIDSDPI
jgi:hypothetical protein